jgi:hypothetical protein
MTADGPFGIGQRNSIPRYHDPVEEQAINWAGDSRQGAAGDGGQGARSGATDPSFDYDITFKGRPGGFEIWYSDRIATDYRELADQSADWLEDQLGVLNLGQVDSRLLIADGLLTDAVRDGLVSWWTERVDDLHVQ